MAVKDRSKMDSVEHFLDDYLLAGESATQNCKKNDVSIQGCV
jgi:hypothetical protein